MDPRPAAGATGDRSPARLCENRGSLLSPTTTGHITHRSPRCRLLTYLGVPYYLERQDGPQEPDPRMEVHQRADERARSVPRRRLHQVRSTYNTIFLQAV